MGIKYLDIPESISEKLSYDPITGNLTWLVSTGRVKKGDIAGCLDSDNYLIVKYKGKIFKAARVCWFLHYKEQPNFVIDHKNRVRSDNRVENLRKTNQSKNVYNTKPRGKSKYKGVTWRKSRKMWLCRTKGHPDRTFNCEKEAALWYNMLMEKYHAGYGYYNKVF